MTSRYQQTPFYLAPGAGSVARMELPGAERLPPPDEHVVEPETAREMIDGRVIRVLPAAPPHADRQVAIGYVLNATVASDYVASSELLTRVSQDSDFATDVCIRKAGKDAEGHRYLEELSFEIKHTQSQRDLDKRARYLTRRGVRRVFAVYVRVETRGGEEHVIAGPIKEWSAASDGWIELADNGAIEDRCLQRPVRVRALLDAFEADNAVAHALIAKQNPVLLARETALVEGERRSILLKLLAQRFGDVAQSMRERVERAELGDLERWLDRVIPAETLADVFVLE